MKNFRSYDLSIKFYQSTQSICLPRHLKDQLQRAASSVTLNLAEGRGKQTLADQKKFFQISYGSARECKAIFDLHPNAASVEIKNTLDHLSASIYLLLKKSG